MKMNNVIQDAHSVILSAHRVILSVATNLFLIALLASCDKVPVPSQKIGPQPSEEQLDGLPAINIQTSSIDNVVEVTMDDSQIYKTEMIYASISKTTSEQYSIQLSIDDSVLEAYNLKHNVYASLLPAPFYDFDNGMTLILNPYEIKSLGLPITIYAKNPLGNFLPEGKYVLPVKVSLSSIGLQDKYLYYIVEKVPNFKGNAKLHDGSDCFIVFYLNTSDYDPRLVTDYYMTRRNGMTFNEEWYCAIGNIVNLRTATIAYEETAQRAILDLGSDLRFLTENYDTYIKPLQDTGRKVCLCIEGGNKGIGFCNLSDYQIDDFVYQVGQVVSQYGFDGVNLWDRRSGYGKDGMPETNMTSYPKLIKSMRKVLGNNKLLTVTDYGDPTSYFYDKSLTGGIEVGNYIDYAWSGYGNGEEAVQIVDPYHQGDPYVSEKYPRLPIAGLSPEKYGCLNISWYTLRGNSLPEYENVMNWRLEGNQQNNIYVYDDIITYLQGALEAGDWTPDKSLTIIEGFEHIYEFDSRFLESLPNGATGYGKWKKNW